MVQEQLPKKSSALYYVVAVALVGGLVGFGAAGIATLSALSILAAVACGIGLIGVAFAITRGGRNTPVVRNR